MNQNYTYIETNGQMSFAAQTQHAYLMFPSYLTGFHQKTHRFIIAQSTKYGDICRLKRFLRGCLPGLRRQNQGKKVPEEERCSPSGRRSENSSVRFLRSYCEEDAVFVCACSWSLPTTRAITPVASMSGSVFPTGMSMRIRIR